MSTQEFSIRARLRSFRFAWSGLSRFFDGEHNAWLHLLATVAVLAAGFITGLKSYEWLALIFSIGLVWITELLNTAIEKLMDFVSVHRRPEIKFIKDLAAAAVLVAAITAIAIGGFIFIPKML